MSGSTYVAINPDDSVTRQEALLVTGASPKKIIDTTSSATYNFICTNLRDDAIETDNDWQIAAWQKVSPYFKLWAVESTTGKVTSAFIFKASDRTNLNFG